MATQVSDEVAAQANAIKEEANVLFAGTPYAKKKTKTVSLDRRIIPY